MFRRGLLSAAGLLACLGCWAAGAALAQVRIEIPDVDVPERRPDPNTGVNMVDLAGGLFALRDGYDRSRRGHICVLTYHDRNGNGRRDRGEGPLPGWGFTIADAAGSPAARGVADAQGRFCNERPLAPGAYSVRQNPGDGWTNTEPGAPSPDIKPVTLPADSSVTVLFGNCRGEGCEKRGPGGPHGPVGPGPGGPPHLLGAKVCVTKYNDLNGNGVRDGAEFGLPSWAFTVRDASGATLASGTTNAQGLFCTPQTLTPGLLSVTETVSGGWTNTDPGGATPVKIRTLASGDVWNVDFGNRLIPNTNICITKFHDLNGDGVRQGNEPGLPGWTFSVSGPPGLGAWSITTGGAAGKACLSAPYSPGAYTAVETPQAGWIATTPGGATQAFTLTVGQPVNLVFGNRSGTPPNSARICVAKYNDLDGDGVRDPGEPGMPGWIFSVKTVGGAMLAFGTTNAQGEWCSTATLPPGAVNVFETAQAGWTSTDPAIVPAGTAPKKATTLAAGQTANVVFGNRTTRVCVAKFNDLNGNGVKNPGEPFLAGWAFSLQGVSGTVLDSGVTNAQGEWCSTAVLPTGYPVSVVETQQAGWQNTSPGGAHKLSPTPTRSLALTAGQPGTVSFGNWIPPATGKVCVRKFRDLNSDGQEGGTGEPVLSGWTFTITGPTGPITLVTGANGKACTPANLTPGSYTVTETLQSGWTNTVPGNATASKVVTVYAVGTADVNFGNVPVAPGILCVNKYQDVVRNNRYDAADPMLAGWSFEVRNSSGALVATGVTDAQGRWCSPSPLPAGTYSVTEVQQSGWVVVDPMGPPNVTPPYRKTALLSPTRGADLFFGNIRSGMACITKYNDLNGNGHRDPGEPPLAGFTFHFQYTSSSHATDVHLTTGPSGEVCLELPPGTSNWVWELPKPGWTKTEGGPGGPGGSVGGHIFTIEEGKTINLAFGNRQIGTPTYGRICVVKFNDLNGDGVKQAGEPLLPGWAFSIPTANGTMSSTTDANGGWCTPQVFPPGTYAVTETLKPGWSATTPGGPSQPAPVTGGLTTTLTFGNRLASPPAKGDLCVTKYHDLDGDGVRDPGEPALPGWTFTVQGGNAAVTGPQGDICWTLAAGAYTIAETQQTGWVSSDPGGANPSKPTTVVGGQTASLAFGNRRTTPPPALGMICVAKYHDLNGDGASVASEPMLPGWQFTIIGPSGPITLTTGANGRACTPANLTLGTYVVAEVMQPGWTNTAPGGTAPQTTIVLTATGIPSASFGNRQTPPAPVRLTVQKIKLTSGMCHGALPAQNECLFQITVANVGGSAYSGPLNFSDTVTGAQATVMTAPGLTCPSGPQSGAFACTAPPTTIPAGGSVTFQVKLFLSSAAPAQKNCVTLTWGTPTQSTSACAQIFP